MEIGSTNAIASVLSQIAAKNAVGTVQQVARPFQGTQTAALQSVAQSRPVSQPITTPLSEPGADQALTYTLEQLRSARSRAMPGSGAVKGQLISVYA